MPASQINAKMLVWLLAAAWSTVAWAAAPIDDNGNGVSDIFEKAYGLTAAGDDVDGDGQTLLQESIAGTDPKNAASVLVTKKFEFLPGNAAHLVWPTVPGKKYQVQVASELGKWQDLSDAVMGDGNDKDVSFPLESTFVTGKILDWRWNLGSAKNLAFVETNAATNVAPSVVNNLSGLTIPVTTTTDNYFGHWVRGWLIPPATGSYQFWIASDDSSDLFLSPDASAARKNKIASVSTSTKYQIWDTFSTQASALINLQANTPYYFEAFQYNGTGGNHLAVAWGGPTIPAKTILDGKYVSASAASLNSQSTGGRSLFFRVSVSDVDSDGDGISDADEILIGYNPNSATTVPRVNDVTVLRSTLSSANVITVGSPQGRAYESAASAARITFFRSGNLGPLTINYTINGTAVSGVDYRPLSGTVDLPVGQNSVSLNVEPIPDSETEPAETVTVQVAPGTGYTAGNPAQTTVTIDDAPDILFVANLRPDPSVRSGGFGTASLNVAGNLVFGNLAVSLGNLTSPQLRTELYVSNTGTGGNTVLTLPTGQIGNTRWDFAPAAGLAQSDILAALADGRLYARVISQAFADGEIYGRFVANQGWQTMPTPPAPPAFSNGAPTPEEAARFLTQATFGPTRASIDELVSMQSYQNWLDQQFNLSPSLCLPYVQARRTELKARNPEAPNDQYWRPLQEAWWQNAIRAPDQLRQRVAFALSEILVISEIGPLADLHEGVANYYDLLVTHAFGNYRTLLKDVTLNPMMGNYLSMIRNQKPNATTGAEPDENYAREVMQLFTVGLSQLHPDGSLKLSNTGMPIPTYTQSDIVGLARVFTGWSYPTPAGASPNYLYGTRDSFNPMVAYESYHDTGEKRIINNTIIPAGQSTAQDLDQAIDSLFNHPNVGPFIARQLIQRLVTSNPSAGYIYRVASVFNDNGSGVRGDLQATVQAILLDYEARSTTLLNDIAFGKQREPVIRMAHLFRAVDIKPPVASDSRLFIDLESFLDAQAPLHSPSVFNFFSPNYIAPGTLAAAGVYSPEFQIASETTSIDQINNQRLALFSGVTTIEPPAPATAAKATFDFVQLLAILNRTGTTAAQNQQALLDELSLLFLNGRMSSGLRTQITEAFAELPSSYVVTNPDYQKNRIRMAINLIFAAPEYVIQK